MGGVDLFDQMKVSCEVDRRSKVRFYLRVLFDFLDISVRKFKNFMVNWMDSIIERISFSGMARH